MKRSSLQKRVRKITAEKFYETNPCGNMGPSSVLQLLITEKSQNYL